MYFKIFNRKVGAKDPLSAAADLFRGSLKQIRQKIADENDIPLVTRECGYQGECSGTCPKCEQELRYLEQQLARRQWAKRSP